MHQKLILFLSRPQVCFTDDKKVENCNCDIAACGCPSATTEAATEAAPTTAEEEEEQCPDETDIKGTEAPPQSQCVSEGGSLCMTKAEIKFYFDMDEYLSGGDPCFNTPLTGTKVSLVLNKSPP